ncbi:RNA polymerase sigma factor [Marinilongibacter aquaticus]|uniref:RNA polymerase sigma factor n=1 Tax=Marinilongibacter aquaticus TaxID=2975157 RepID=UPI0021BDD41F|nr:RNA polymerase sigma factor [Marinilongibacter aquaticus]UBM57904.1 RNA polymerase sigma factor [Marinilongibacter aquaticus]
MHDEKQIIERCLKQDRLAQKQLYDLYSGRLFVVALRYMKDEDEAQDVLQDAFIKVFKYLDTFRADSPIEVWLRKIVVNTALKALKRKSNLTLALDGDHMINHEYHHQNLGFENLSLQHLLKMIGDLPEGCRTVFNLYAIDGYKHNEIADMLGVTEGTSKSQYSRAKGLLQEKLRNGVLDIKPQNVE